ncbi:MAG: FAD-binding oxidoreductase [Gammaproteobacteria bacterium]|nr:FAD-binding oxidoreductase [Gammaproteobacteria bacterium]
MMRATHLSGWGRYPIRECRVATLRREEQLADWSQTKTLIARGNGRSYGDAALNPELTLSMLARDRLLAFDSSRGVLSCEAGVLLADLLRVYAPQGWFPPVVPGTADVTVGGMIAADVHGKNHHRDGSFGAHVESFRLAGGNGDVLTCSREENLDLFRATLGGMGLTGVVLSACFRMCRIESEHVRTETLGTPDLDATMETLAASNDWRYSVAWLDGSAEGGNLGRGLVSRGDFATRDDLSGQSSAYRSRAPVSRQLPTPALLSGALNPASVRLFDALYNRVGRFRKGPRLVHHTSFFFPLDRLQRWNRLYGRRGFVQYQCVLPVSQSSRGLRAILERVATSDHIAYLAVLKLLGPQGEGMLSFPLSGYTLALDFPMRPGTLELLDSLDEITTAHGGRVYLAKDARCRPDHVQESYADLPSFVDVRQGATSGTREFSSVMSRRLGL